MTTIWRVPTPFPELDRQLGECLAPDPEPETEAARQLKRDALAALDREWSLRATWERLPWKTRARVRLVALLTGVVKWEAEGWVP